MKPFDLEQAKAGKPIVTRDRTPVTFGAHLPTAAAGYRLAIIMDNGWVYPYHEDGTWDKSLGSDPQHPRDLFMAPVKRELWMVKRVLSAPMLSVDGNGNTGWHAWTFDSERVAKDFMAAYNKDLDSKIEGPFKLVIEE